MPIATAARAVFAATLIVVGLQGLFTADFGAIWQPVAKGAPVRGVLVYLCALVSLAGGSGLLWRRTAAPAARGVLGWLLLWLLLFRLPQVVRALATIGPWESAAETVVVVAGAWILYALLAPAWDRRHLRMATGDIGLHVARVVYALAMIPFGLAHFAYLAETASLVPAWLPAHTAWAAATGAAYVAAGLAMLAGVRGRLAAALSASQMSLFTLLVWLPVVARGGASVFQWNETLISLALSASGWLVAESWRRR